MNMSECRHLYTGIQKDFPRIQMWTHYDNLSYVINSHTSKMTLIHCDEPKIKDNLHE